ncbi:hypothetical protein J6590_067060 [Homalodisca vitripennis]|nr:hypothetical protein J6590_067060 [Homalodisca vitripennis]
MYEISWKAEAKRGMVSSAYCKSTSLDVKMYEISSKAEAKRGMVSSAYCKVWYLPNYSHNIETTDLCALTCSRPHWT